VGADITKEQALQVDNFTAATEFILPYDKLSRYHFPSVLWCYQLGNRKGIRPVKALHQNPLAIVVDISEWVQAVVPYGNPTCLSTQPRGQLAYPGAPRK